MDPGPRLILCSLLHSPYFTSLHQQNLRKISGPPLDQILDPLLLWVKGTSFHLPHTWYDGTVLFSQGSVCSHLGGGYPSQVLTGGSQRGVPRTGPDRGYLPWGTPYPDLARGGIPTLAGGGVYTLARGVPTLGYPLADLRGGARDARPLPLGPNSFIFMQFSGKF